MRRLVSVVTSLWLVGCAASGTKVDQHTLADLRPGQTRCTEVRERYGTPTSVVLSSEGHEQLSYLYQQTQVRALSFVPIASMLVRGADTEHTSVVFECVGGVLTSYSSTQGQMGSGTGFISGGKQ